VLTVIQGIYSSNGWLGGFKRPHDITFKKMSGESSSVPIDTCTPWRRDLPSVLEDFKPKDIFQRHVSKVICQTIFNFVSFLKLQFVTLDKTKSPIMSFHGYQKPVVKVTCATAARDGATTCFPRSTVGRHCQRASAEPQCACTCRSRTRSAVGGRGREGR